MKAYNENKEPTLGKPESKLSFWIYFPLPFHQVLSREFLNHRKDYVSRVLMGQRHMIQKLDHLTYEDQTKPFPESERRGWKQSWGGPEGVKGRARE